MIIDATNSFCVSNLRYLRKKYCLSRRALARLIGISEITLRGMEEETQPPLFRTEQLRRVGVVFNITMEELFHRDLPRQGIQGISADL